MNDHNIWVFTFGSGQEHEGCYIVIEGNYSEARKEMHRRFGAKWGFQYASEEEAGVEKYKLKKIS